MVGQKTFRVLPRHAVTGGTPRGIDGRPTVMKPVMTTRRDALKTIAGATVVGSLSGCVQLATQRTTHFRGTPAMVTLERPYQGMDDFYAIAVGVEGHRTIERFGVTREIVVHSWGMLYQCHVDPTGGICRGHVATFATPSIEIAGRELNPIKDLTVGDIASELQFITELESNVPRAVAESDHGVLYSEVNDATGQTVVRAFRSSVYADDSASAVSSTEFQDAWSESETIPDWNGDTYEFDSSNVARTEAQAANDDGSVPGYSGLNQSIRFDMDGGDFIVMFQSLPTGKTIDSQQIAHPPDEDFSREMLQRHLIDTNLRVEQGLVKRGRQLVDETQELLQGVNPPEEQRQREKFHGVVSDTQDDLQRLDELLGGVGEDLSSLGPETIIGGSGNDTLRRVNESSEEAATVATTAHERVASYNETRNEENETFIAIERNLGGIMQMAENLPGFTASWTSK